MWDTEVIIVPFDEDKDMYPREDSLDVESQRVLCSARETTRYIHH
jgi:hypothetical protein